MYPNFLRDTDGPSGTASLADVDATRDRPIATKGPCAALPLVSVIVVNFNYGHFLEDAVSSVYAQTYSNVECVLVDNDSTDHTAAVIATLETRYPTLRTVRRSSNSGQTAAALDGLAASRGQYVVFLDADDFLLPTAIETHIYVHLSMRLHVGFTSGDMLQIVGKEIVLSTGEASSCFVRHRKSRGDLLRPYVHRGEGTWPSRAVADNIEKKVHYVRPRRSRWVWAPTSGLCFRRDALLLFSDNPSLANLRTGTDIYFALACGGISGSVLIDEPVFAYRIHGENVFTRRPQLANTLAYTPNADGDSNDQARRVLVDHLVRTAARFTQMPLLLMNYLLLALSLDVPNPGVSRPRWARRSRLASTIVEEYATFAAATGGILARLVVAWAARTWREPEALQRSMRVRQRGTNEAERPVSD